MKTSHTWIRSGEDYCCYPCRISEEDFEVLAGNLQLLVVHQREVFDKMHETVERDVNNAKIGGILLRAAPLLRQLLRFYWVPE
uniref:Uncharacterized protein n=1 Tax=Parascaris equorum TaxID=6256 RepID=A0A914RXQ3_PAREQ